MCDFQVPDTEINMRHQQFKQGKIHATPLLFCGKIKTILSCLRSHELQCYRLPAWCHSCTLGKKQANIQNTNTKNVCLLCHEEYIDTIKSLTYSVKMNSCVSDYFNGEEQQA